MASQKVQETEKTVDPDLLSKALAKAAAQGDIVNFQLLFLPFSPGRADSPERFESDKYAYLLPTDDECGQEAYRSALDLVKRDDLWAHISSELEAERPARLPAPLVLALADNAVRLKKYTAAAQAFELLRIRKQMQEEFYLQADQAFEADDIEKAAHGYLVGAGLAYDYAAFPDPLPKVPDYQTKALMLHGEYPTDPQNCLAFLEPEAHVNAALEFLLNDEDAAGRLRPLSMEKRLACLKELAHEIDPAWEEFVRRYRKARTMAQEYGKRLERLAAPGHRLPETLEEEIDEQDARDPMAVTIQMLGREIEHGRWWQYLKELAYEHPPAILFVARQAVGEEEILVPRHRPDSPAAKALNLIDSSATNASPV